MKPIMQTAFRDPDGRDRGNCLAAALASVMEVEIDTVPHFVQLEENGGRYWWDAMQAWLAERNLWMVSVPRCDVIYPGPTEPPFLLASGVSPRDPDGRTKHMVVYRSGRIVHDPHPDGTGLVGDREMWGFYALARLDPSR